MTCLKNMGALRLGEIDLARAYLGETLVFEKNIVKPDFSIRIVNGGMYWEPSATFPFGVGSIMLPPGPATSTTFTYEVVGPSGTVTIESGYQRQYNPSVENMDAGDIDWSHLSVTEQKIISSGKHVFQISTATHPLFEWPNLLNSEGVLLIRASMQGMVARAALLIRFENPIAL